MAVLACETRRAFLPRGAWQAGQESGQKYSQQSPKAPGEQSGPDETVWTHPSEAEVWMAHVGESVVACERQAPATFSHTTPVIGRLVCGATEADRKNNSDRQSPPIAFLQPVIFVVSLDKI